MKIEDFLNENNVDGPFGEYHGSLEETLQKLEGDLEELKAVQETCLELNTAILKLDMRRESILALGQEIDRLKNRLSKKETEKKKFTDSREKLEAETEKLNHEISELESKLEGFDRKDTKVGKRSEIQQKIQENQMGTFKLHVLLQELVQMFPKLSTEV